MIFLAVIIGLVILFLFLRCIQWNNARETYGFGIFCGWVLATLLVLEMMCIYESVSKPSSKAMDVYQDKTTLEYTIRDSEVIDSVVVWKRRYR